MTCAATPCASVLAFSTSTVREPVSSDCCGSGLRSSFPSPSRTSWPTGEKTPVGLRRRAESFVDAGKRTALKHGVKAGAIARYDHVIQNG